MDSFPGLPDVYFAQRIIHLVDTGALESQDNLRRMRFSEVRKPSPALSIDKLNDLISKKLYCTLGNIYAEGEGVSKDYAEALKWLLLSANQGSKWCQFNVGRFYEDGLGVAPSKTEAYFWYGVATRIAHPDNMPFKDFKDRIAPLLTTEEKIRLDERIESWCPTSS
jgi:TPR repeat protein